MNLYESAVTESPETGPSASTARASAGDVPDARLGGMGIHTWYSRARSRPLRCVEHIVERMACAGVPAMWLRADSARACAFARLASARRATLCSSARCEEAAREAYPTMACAPSDRAASARQMATTTRGR